MPFKSKLAGDMKPVRSTGMKNELFRRGGLSTVRVRTMSELLPACIGIYLAIRRDIVANRARFIKRCVIYSHPSDEENAMQLNRMQ